MPPLFSFDSNDDYLVQVVFAAAVALVEAERGTTIHTVVKAVPRANEKIAVPGPPVAQVHALHTTDLSTISGLDVVLNCSTDCSLFSSCVAVSSRRLADLC